MELALEQELLRLAAEGAGEELPPEGEWSEWSPVPFGKVPEPSVDEPLEFDDDQPRRAA